MSTASAKRYGFIGIIITDRERQGGRVNRILSDHADAIVGRLGMPNLENGALSIVTLIVHATTDVIGSITGKLGALEGVSVKSGLHKTVSGGDP